VHGQSGTAQRLYIAPIPFALVDGTAHRRTLILPSERLVPWALRPIGSLGRREVDEVVAAYSFHVRTNELATRMIPNPTRGRERLFTACRLDGDPFEEVVVRGCQAILEELEPPSPTSCPGPC
jgi:hypothetical protein